MNMTDIDIKNTAEDAEIIEHTSTEVCEEKETVTFTKFEVKVLFNPAFESIKINELSKEDKIKLIKLKIEFGKIATALQEFEKSVVESLKDNTYTNLETEASKAEATEEIKEEFKKLQTELTTKVNEVCIEEYNANVEIVFDRITEDAFYTIINSVDLTGLGGYEYMYNKLVNNKNNDKRA